MRKKTKKEVNENVKVAEVSFKKMEIFDYLKALTDGNENLDFDNDEIEKNYQPYMINRFISMCDLYVPIVNEINKYDIPKKAHFQYFFSILPKRKQFFNYIKKKKDLNENQKIILCNYFQIGKKEVDEYIRLLDESQIEEILEIYRYGKNDLAGL
jgi:hypothetical protein